MAGSTQSHRGQTDRRRETLESTLAWSNPNRPLPDVRPTDLDAIVQCAYDLGLANSVIWNLKRGGYGDLLAADDLHFLEDQWAKSLLVFHEAGNAIAGLHEAGVSVAGLKGFAFATTLYAAHPEVRGMADVDLLVERRTFRETERVLSALGWHARRVKPVTSRLSVELSFLKTLPSDPPVEIALDVHRRLTTRWRYTVDHRALWRRLERGQGPRPGILDPVDALLHLAVHKSQEGYRNQLRDLVDAANLIDAGVSWPDLVTRAREWSCAGAAWLFLSRAGTSVGARVPSSVLVALAPGMLRRWLLTTTFPDGATELDFVRQLNKDRRLLPKLAGALIATDAPVKEATALTLISLRQGGDAVVGWVPPLEPACKLLERIPL